MAPSDMIHRSCGKCKAEAGVEQIRPKVYLLLFIRLGGEGRFPQVWPETPWNLSRRRRTVEESKDGMAISTPYPCQTSITKGSVLAADRRTRKVPNVLCCCLRKIIITKSLYFLTLDIDPPRYTPRPPKTWTGNKIVTKNNSRFTFDPEI